MGVCEQAIVVAIFLCHCSSRIPGSELAYLSKNVDRLLSVISLYLSRPDEVSTQLAHLMTSCNFTSFYCNLCAFAMNITTSCEE